jgi:HK97 family phage portal protein
VNWFSSFVDGLSGIVRLGTRTSQDPQPGMANESYEPVNESTVLALPAAIACIVLLGGTISTLPLMVYRPKGTGREVATDHWLYRIIHDDPNADQTAVDFWEFMCVALEMRGNAIAEKLRGSMGQIVGLDPIPPAIVGRSRRSDGKIEYRWTWDGKSRVETSDNILHIRGFGGDPLGGMSTLALGAETFGLARAQNRTASGVIRNAMRPSGVWQSDTKMNADQVKEVEDRLALKYQGAAKAGRPLVMGSGLKWQQLTMSPEDLQMLESRSFSVEEICRLFGVPPHLIGHTAGNTQLGSSITEQTRGFEKFALRRRLKRIEQSLRKQLLTPEDIARGITIEFNMEGLLRGSPAERSAFYGAGLDKGWLNVNQVCAWENLPPVPGGDINRVQMQNVPLTMTGTGQLAAALPAE